MSRGKTKTPPEHETLGTAVTASRGWIVCIAVGLFLARYLLPAEGAATGQTVVLATAWLGLAVVASYLDWRSGRRWQFDWRDAALVALTGPPILAGLVSQFAALDQRAAQNLLLEWVSLTISLLLMRRCLEKPGFRRMFGAGIVSMMTAVACHGLWQHYVWYPETAALLLEYERLEELPSPSSSEQSRMQELLQMLGPEFVGADEVARKMMRDRLVSSTEPLGFFALANTLAGLIGVAGILFACASRGSTRGEQVVQLVCGVLLLITFVLSKSRTAYLSAFAAGAVGVLLVFGRAVPWKKVGMTAAGLAALALLLLLTGGLDLAVLTESSRSLAYRVEYWTASLAMLGDWWLTGVGLGNFRDEYLRYKLPGSSEEILDPHNWVLESWATSGLLGLIGACGATGTLIWSSGRLAVTAASEQKPDVAGRVLPPIVVAAFIGLVWNGFPIHFDGSILMVGGIACLVAAFGRWVWTDAAFRRAGVSLSVFLTIHLLASGGFGMPAVMQTLLAGLLVFASPVPVGRILSDNATHVLQAGLVGSLLLAILFVVQPNLARDRWMTDAETRTYFENDLAGAARSLKRAHDADPKSFKPLLNLASIYAVQKKSDEAKQAALQAVATSPDSPTLKQWAAKLLTEIGDEQAAADMIAQAANAYPNGADVRADAAEAFARIGDARAADEAKVAIELDELNTAAGHTDKIFDESRRKRLEEIAGGGQ